MRFIHQAYPSIKIHFCLTTVVQIGDKKQSVNPNPQRLITQSKTATSRLHEPITMPGLKIKLAI
jgi:hypothetical protein